MHHIVLRISLTLLAFLFTCVSLYFAVIGCADPEGRTNIYAACGLGLAGFFLLSIPAIWLIG